MSTHKLSAPPPPSSERESKESQAFALHEVSNALTVVLGWLDLGVRAETVEELKHALGVAREHARRGQVLARRAIGAQVESQACGGTAREVGLFVADSLRPAAEGRGLRVRVEAGAGTEGYVGDEAALVQVLTNILLNAVQFSPARGEIHLTVSRDGDDFSFLVRDQGPGIPPDRREILFLRPTTTREGGAGLGLSLSRRLARDRGGDLRYIAEPRGGCFEVRWPVATGAPVRPSFHVETAESLQGARLLIIEDDAAVASLIEMSCEARGAETVIVTSREELTLLLRGRPVFDVILMDLSPLEHCLEESLDELATLEPVAPVLLISGQPHGAPTGVERRFASWIRKPFDMEQLVRSIADLRAENTCSGLVVPAAFP